MGVENAASSRHRERLSNAVFMPPKMAAINPIERALTHNKFYSLKAVEPP